MIDRAEELKQIKELFNQSNYSKALQAMKRLETIPEFTTDNQLMNNFWSLKVRILKNLGDHQALITLAEDILKESQKQGTLLQGVDVIIHIARALNGIGQYSESLKVAKQAEDVIDSEPKLTPEVKQRKAAVLNVIGLYWMNKNECERALKSHRQSLAIFKELSFKPGITHSLLCLSWDYFFCKLNLDRVRDYAQQSLALAEEIGHKEFISHSLNMLAAIHRRKRNLESALELHQKSLAIRKELGDKDLIAGSLHNIALVYRDQGNLDQALEFFLKSLTIVKQIGNKYGIANGYVDLGRLHSRKGDYTQALEYLHKSLAMFKTLGKKVWILDSLLFITEVYQERGDIDEAMDCCHQSLALAEELDLKPSQAMAINNLGEIYRSKGEFELAYKYLQKSLSIFEELDYREIIFNNLFSLILLCINLNNIDEARSYLQLLKPVEGQMEDKYCTQAGQVAEALILKTSTRVRNRGKAEVLLETVVNDDVVDHRLTVIAIFHLCDLLLLELQVTDDLEVLNDVQNLVLRLLDTAKSQYSFSLMAQTYVLQSRLALLELDIPKAKNLLIQAHVLAEEKGLQNLALKIVEEQNTLNAQINTWEEFIKRKASMSEIIEFTRIDDYIETIVHNKLFHKEVDVLNYAKKAQSVVKTFEAG